MGEGQNEIDEKSHYFIGLGDNKMVSVFYVFQFRKACLLLLNELDWLVLSERRRQHRLSFVFKCIHGLIAWNFNFTHLREIHPYNTRHKDNVRMPKSRCSGDNRD